MIASIAKRPVGSLVGCTCVAVLGLIAATQIPVNFFPEIRHPALTITTELSDADPEEIETLITTKIEEALMDLPGLREISSISRAGRSRVVLEFHVGGNVSEAALEVRGRIRRLWPSFPQDTRFPVLTHYNPSDDPIAVLGVTGKMPLSDLSHWTDQTLKPLLNRINGVAAVQVAGSGVLEIKVDCDADRLMAFGATVHQVAMAIKSSHSSRPGGFLTVEGKRLALRTTGNLRSAEDVAKQPVMVSKEGALVTVEDVARVKKANDEPETIARLNGKPLIAVGVYRAPDADMRHLWSAVKARIHEINSAFKSEAKVEVIFSQAEQLEETLERLKMLAALAVLAAGITLFLFLRTISSTLIILTSIPFSMLLALLFMRIFGIPLDVLSLTGLSLALGIVVDSAIVVIEAISKRLSENASSLTEAVIRGTQEVAVPVIFSTLTAVMVFLPLVFVSARIRTYFVGLTWTVCLSLAASLVAALVLVPVLFRLVGRSKSRRGIAMPRRLDHRSLYDRVLGLTVAHPVPIISASLLFLVGAGFLATQLSYRQDWGIAEQGFRVGVVTPPGTAPNNTVRETQIAENMILELPGVQRVYSRIYDNQGKITVTMKKGTTSDVTNESMSTLRQKLKSPGKTEYHVLPLRSGGSSRQLSVTLYGPTMEGLMEQLLPVHRKLARLAGVETVIVQQGNPRLEAQFVLRHDVMGASGVRAAELATDLRERFTGPVAARIFHGEREVQVRVRAERELTEGLKSLQHAFVRGHGQQLIPFAELAEPTVKPVPTEIHRKNRRRCGTVSVVYAKDHDPIEIARHVQEAMAEIKLPAAYSFKLGEEVDRILSQRKEMLTTAGIALLLIYLVLVAATESLVQPFLIITAAPFAAGGAIIALTVFGYSVNLPVYMGMIILCGLVVNVNIVLVYAINDRLRSGDPPATAVLQGTRRRLRPVLMTTLTTVCGALPMLLDRGAGSSTWAPLSLTLASGLTASALFSLVLTPAAYAAMIRLRGLASNPATPRVSRA